MKFAAAILSFASAVLAGPAQLHEKRLPVQVPLPAASGTVTGRSVLEVDTFNGIPFADPPVGPLRLKPPKRLSTNLGQFDATGLPPTCPQMYISDEALGIIGGVATSVLELPIFQTIEGVEDCLTINVQRPAGTKKGDKLPVLFWMFGGGFELGGTFLYDGSTLLAEAIVQGQPFVFVAVNYRVAGFGFLPGSEILKDGSANLGLLDQRLGLEWVADNIAEFGGDPVKVTIWGESAGSISVFDQMALYDGDAKYKGKPLFRAGIMNSGSISSAEPVDSPKAQAVYDEVVAKAGCSGAADTLQCLRDLDYHTFLNAVNAQPGLLSYNSAAVSYLPRPDGKVLTDSTAQLAKSGKYYAVPTIIGDQEDEGTLFALFQPNITDTAALVSYLKTLYFQSATTQQVTDYVNTYPADISAGSPFRTGLLNELYPGFKRRAALLGDYAFTLSRRVYLEYTTKAYPNVPSWSYLSSYLHVLPILGTVHTSDIFQTFYGIQPDVASTTTRTYYFNFLYNLDPNVQTGIVATPTWPKWSDSKQLAWFKSPISISLLSDDFRTKSYEYLRDNLNVLKI